MKTTIRAVVGSLIFMTPVMMNAAVSAGTKAPSTGTTSKEVFKYAPCNEDIQTALTDAGALKPGDNCQVATSQSSGQVQIVIGGMGVVTSAIPGNHEGPYAPPIAVQGQTFGGQSAQ